MFGQKKGSAEGKASERGEKEKKGLKAVQLIRGLFLREVMAVAHLLMKQNNLVFTLYNSSTPQVERTAGQVWKTYSTAQSVQ